MSPSKRAVLSGKCTQNMDTKSQSPALWYPHLTGCHCTFWGICRHCQILPPLSFFLCIGQISPLNQHKYLFTLAMHQNSPVHNTQDVSNSASELCNSSTNWTIQRLYSPSWHLSSRELKNKIALIQDFPGWGCFCCRLILKKCSYTLNTSNFWTLLEAHLPFSQLLHCQAGLETFQEQDFDFQYIVILL